MQIVIDIPKYVVGLCCEDNVTAPVDIATLIHAVKVGIPLPEGHGRLIDADSMKTMKNIQSANFNAVELIRYWIDNQPTIIEADKENDSEDNN